MNYVLELEIDCKITKINLDPLVMRMKSLLSAGTAAPSAAVLIELKPQEGERRSAQVRGDTVREFGNQGVARKTADIMFHGVSSNLLKTWPAIENANFEVMPYSFFNKCHREYESLEVTIANIHEWYCKKFSFKNLEINPNNLLRSETRIFIDEKDFEKLIPQTLSVF
uniref:Uncharacterized protein n=1 Tax=Ditylenchus dipsaci TaxID=166011 RepID=A0A915DNM0_9BILA